MCYLTFLSSARRKQDPSVSEKNCIVVVHNNCTTRYAYHLTSTWWKWTQVSVTQTLLFIMRAKKEQNTNAAKWIRTKNNNVETYMTSGRGVSRVGGGTTYIILQKHLRLPRHLKHRYNIALTLLENSAISLRSQDVHQNVNGAPLQLTIYLGTTRPKLVQACLSKFLDNLAHVQSIYIASVESKNT